MVNETFLIYVDRLKGGNEETIDQTVPSTLIGVNEADLKFEGNLHFEGKAYIAEDHLVLHLDVEATAVLPCKICNEPQPLQIELHGFYHTEPMETIKSGIFDMHDVVRDAILLEVPPYHECESGACRQEAQKYLKSDVQKGDEYHPFADL